MDERDFSTRLKDIKAEVLALKQSFKRGLGRADFPSEEINLTSPGDCSLRLTVVFTDNIVELPFLQIWINGGRLNAVGNVFSNHTYIEAFDYSSAPGWQLKMLVVATAPIVSATLEVV